MATQQIEDRIEDLDWLGERSSSLIGGAISSLTAEDMGGGWELGIASHVGLCFRLSRERRRALGQDGHELPAELIGRACVLEALTKISITPLEKYLTGDQPLLIARFGHATWWNRARQINTLLNLVGHDYGYRLLLAHGLGRALGWGLDLLGAKETARQYPAKTVRAVDGELVCSTLAGMGLSPLGARFYRVADPAQRPLEHLPLTPKHQTPDDQADQIVWHLVHPTDPPLWQVVYHRDLVPSTILTGR